MKNKHDAGFSLIEVLVAIVILAAIVVPTCSSLVLSHRMNAKTEELMQAQLDVSSAVETLMAEGIEASEVSISSQVEDEALGIMEDPRFPNVNIVIREIDTERFCYIVTFTSGIDGSVKVETMIHTEGQTILAGGGSE